MAKKPTYESVLANLRQGLPVAKSDPDLLTTDVPVVVQHSQILTLDQLRPYDRNPRRTRNFKYEDLKDSIRSIGLINPFTVTRRPNDPDPRWMIEGGGNTRLKILNELWQETAERRFYELTCIVQPWRSEIVVYAKHLAENEGDLRSELLPVDKALALKELREMIEGDAGKRMSASGFVRELEQLGLSAISRRQLGRLEFLVGLSEVLPVTLRIDPGTSGLGNNQIDQLINLKKGLLKFWCDKNKLDQTFEILWDQELSVYDANGYFEIDDFRVQFIIKIAKETGANAKLLELELIDGDRRREKPGPDTTQPAGPGSPLPVAGGTSAPAGVATAAPEPLVTTPQPPAVAPSVAPVLPATNPAGTVRPALEAAGTALDAAPMLEAVVSVPSESLVSEQGRKPTPAASVPQPDELRLLVGMAVDPGELRSILQPLLDTTTTPDLVTLMASLLAERAGLPPSCVVPDEYAFSGFYVELPSVCIGQRDAGQLIDFLEMAEDPDGWPKQIEWRDGCDPVSSAVWWYLYGLGGVSVTHSRHRESRSGQSLLSLHVHDACFETGGGDLQFMATIGAPGIAVTSCVRARHADLAVMMDVLEKLLRAR